MCGYMTAHQKAWKDSFRTTKWVTVKSSYLFIAVGVEI